MSTSIRLAAWRAFAMGCTALTGLALAAGAETAQVEWQLSAPLPHARAGYAAGVVKGRLILAGGTYWLGGAGKWTEKVFCPTTHAFDPNTEKWEQLPDAPVSLGYAPGAAVGNRLFVIGGVQDGRPSRRVLILERNATGFSWRDGPPLPEARVFAEAAVMRNRIFVVGGSREFETLDDSGLCCASQTTTTTVWSLDTTETNANWQSHAAFPGHRRWTARLVADGRHLYQFGGRFVVAKEQSVRYFDEVWRFDTARDEWAEIAALPSEIQLSRPVVAAGAIILIGRGQRSMVFDPRTGGFSDGEGLPEDALVDHFAWMPPFIVGAGGETRHERPRRRADWTFIGRLKTPSGE